MEKYANAFELLASEFEQAGISVILVGGFAVNLYKVTRSTKDIDFLIPEEDYEKARAVLQEAGYKELKHDKIFARLVADFIAPSEVDLLFTDPQTFKTVLKEGREVTLSGKRFRLPSLEHLIALKLHAIKCNPPSRELRDLRDILELVRANEIKVKTERFRNLCLKFGNQEIYEKILSYSKG